MGEDGEMSGRRVLPSSLTCSAERSLPHDAAKRQKWAENTTQTDLDATLTGRDVSQESCQSCRVPGYRIGKTGGLDKRSATKKVRAFCRRFSLLDVIEQWIDQP